MTGWRHTDDRGGICDVPVRVLALVPCGCTNPRPDPASPCGECDEGQLAYRHSQWAAYYERDDSGFHAHIPTLCICHHAIEVTK